jgi:hypothetical protein
MIAGKKIFVALPFGTECAAGRAAVNDFIKAVRHSKHIL